jgi:hypothetical protein
LRIRGGEPPQRLPSSRDSTAPNQTWIQFRSNSFK